MTSQKFLELTTSKVVQDYGIDEFSKLLGSIKEMIDYRTEDFVTQSGGKADLAPHVITKIAIFVLAQVTKSEVEEFIEGLPEQLKNELKMLDTEVWFNGSFN